MARKAIASAPVTRRCRKCLRPLGAIDWPALDWRCLICRLGDVLACDEIAVVGVERDGLITAVQYVDSKRVAERLSFAWKRVKLEVVVVEPERK